MILELDASLLDKLNISINQLVFLTLVLSDIKKEDQSIQKLLSLVNEEEIQELVSQDLVAINYIDDTKEVKATDKLKELVKADKPFFELFYNQFPVYVIRPDGTKGFLRTNINKCKKEYNRIIGRSKAMHEHMMDCLRYEIENRMRTGKMGYMKSMWKWLTQCEWEIAEEQMKIEGPISDDIYGSTIY